MSEAPLGSGVPITVEEGHPVKRVLLLTHREPDVTASTLPTVMAILQEAGVQVLVPAGEVVKHRILAPFSSGDGMVLKSGGEDLILVLGGDGSILRALAREAGSGAPVIAVRPPGGASSARSITTRSRTSSARITAGRTSPGSAGRRMPRGRWPGGPPSPRGPR